MDLSGSNGNSMHLPHSLSHFLRFRRLRSLEPAYRYETDDHDRAYDDTGSGCHRGEHHHLRVLLLLVGVGRFRRCWILRDDGFVHCGMDGNEMDRGKEKEKQTEKVSWFSVL